MQTNIQTFRDKLRLVRTFTLWTKKNWHVLNKCGSPIDSWMHNSHKKKLKVSAYCSRQTGEAQLDALQQLDAQAKQEKHNWMPKPDVSDVFSAYCRGLLLRPHGATSLCSAVFGRGRERQRAGVCRHMRICARFCQPNRAGEQRIKPPRRWVADDPYNGRRADDFRSGHEPRPSSRETTAPYGSSINDS